MDGHAGGDDDMTRSDQITEADLAAQVTGWLHKQHWKVYPEVRPQVGGPRADIVAVQAGRVWVIECKTSFSLSVIAQANNWMSHAHWISIATPRKWQQRRAESELKREILRWKGIGYLRVSGINGVQSMIPPRLNRHARTGLITQSLCDAHIEKGIAGSRNSYHTPFRATCARLLEYVTANPGCSLKDAIVNSQHHYERDSTAVSCLHKWIRFGKVPGVCRRRVGRNMLIYPISEAPA